MMEGHPDNPEIERRRPDPSLVSRAWRVTSLSLVAVLMALSVVLIYVIIGIQEAQDLQEDHHMLSCRDAIGYDEDRALSDGVVVFLEALLGVTQDVPVDPEALQAAVDSFNDVQDEHDAKFVACLNAGGSFDGQLEFPTNG